MKYFLNNAVKYNYNTVKDTRSDCCFSPQNARPNNISSLMYVNVMWENPSPFKFYKILKIKKLIKIKNNFAEAKPRLIEIEIHPVLEKLAELFDIKDFQSCSISSFASKKEIKNKYYEKLDTLFLKINDFYIRRHDFLKYNKLDVIESVNEIFETIAEKEAFTEILENLINTCGYRTLEFKDYIDFKTKKKQKYEITLKEIYSYTSLQTYLNYYIIHSETEYYNPTNLIDCLNEKLEENEKISTIYITKNIKDQIFETYECIDELNNNPYFTKESIQKLLDAIDYLVEIENILEQIIEIGLEKRR